MWEGLIVIAETHPVVAVLDDEAPMRKALGRLLKIHGFAVESFADGGEFLTAAALHPPDCLLLDLHMPGITGFDVLATLADRPAPPPVVVITAHDEPGTAERALKLGAAAYLLKPLDEDALLEGVRSAIQGGRAGRSQITKPDAACGERRST